MMDWWYPASWSWNGWLPMAAMMILFTAAIVLIVWALLPDREQRDAHRSLDTPRAVLDRRLAAGEIDYEQYAEARRLIEGQGVTPLPR